MNCNKLDCKETFYLKLNVQMLHPTSGNNNEIYCNVILLLDDNSTKTLQLITRVPNHFIQFTFVQANIAIIPNTTITTEPYHRFQIVFATF